MRLDERTYRWRLAGLAIALLGLLAAAPVSRAQDNPLAGVRSKYYIVINASTGEVYAQQGAHEHVPLASLTKIFTAIEAMEVAPGSYTIVTSDADMVDSEATQVGFGAGETFSLTDMIYGMLLPSGNDAARAVARSLGAEPGDSPEQAVNRFMDRTNQRLQDMGLTETHLVNPDGWGVPDHYSSAHDIAAFTMYALQYPRFVQAISTRTYDMSSGGYELTNTNKTLGAYDDLVGGKTGYDDTAGYCLMQMATRGDVTMIAVTLDGVAPDIWYEDNRTLLDYGFDQAAARAANAAAPTGAEFVRYLDPDAKVIQAFASSNVMAGQSGGVTPRMIAANPAAEVPSVETTSQTGIVEAMVANAGGVPANPEPVVNMTAINAGTGATGLAAAAEPAVPTISQSDRIGAVPPGGLPAGIPIFVAVLVIGAGVLARGRRAADFPPGSAGSQG